MTSGPIKTGDIVKCDVQGTTFLAMVKAKGPGEDVRLKRGEIRTEPIIRSFGNVRIVTARQIVGHWRKRK